MLITPSGGCASTRSGRLRRRAERDRPIVRPVPPHREQDAREAARQRDDRDALSPPRGESFDPGMQRRAALTLAPHVPRRLDQQRAHGPGPAFVIAPFRCRVPELSSRGTSPRKAVAAPASRKRSDVSSAAPIRQRHDRADARRRHQPADDRVGRGARPRRRRRSREHGREASNNVAQRRQAARSARGQRQRGDRVHHRLAPARTGRIPSWRNCARSRLIACVRIRTSCSRIRTAAAPPLRRGHAMRRAVDPQAARLGQRRHIALVRLDPPRPLPYINA